MSAYHYGITIKEFREKKGMTQAQLAQVWPRSGGEVGVSTDFVFHSLSGVLAERSYGYLELKEPQSTLAMKEEIQRQIAIEGNVWLDAWIPLDWARAHLMLGHVNESVEFGREFYHKAVAIKSPHATSRAIRLLNTLERAGYEHIQAVKDFRKELGQEAQGQVDTTDVYEL